LKTSAQPSNKNVCTIDLMLNSKSSYWLCREWRNNLSR